MQIKNYLENKQPILYKTIINAFKSNKLSHAYLIIGESGTPLKQTALYLAKSLLCDNPNPLACDNCITCMRVDNNAYNDVIIYDGSESQISKNNIDRITNTFSKTASESKGIVIYILHLIENSDARATNALLKFLEEPGQNTFAFLTTQNEARVLPTIVSRCQRLTLRVTSRQEVIDIGNKEGINREDLELLSHFYIDVNEIKTKLSDNKYIAIKKCALNFLTNINDCNRLIYLIDTEFINAIGNKEDARLCFDILSAFFEDVIRKSNHEKIFLSSYDKIIGELSSSLKNIDSILLELMNLRSKINLNINITSIFEHFAKYICEAQHE